MDLYRSPDFNAAAHRLRVSLEDFNETYEHLLPDDGLTPPVRQLREGLSAAPSIPSRIYQWLIDLFAAACIVAIVAGLWTVAAVLS
jgi:hypothetical protein